MENTQTHNPLATAKITSLICKFAIPSVVAGLVSALYNIVDQIFIGQKVGLLGNAATNIAFPMTTIGMALGLLLGVGTSANFSLDQGRGNIQSALRTIGSGISGLAIVGVALGVIMSIFLGPLLYLFGATDEVYPYAIEYGRIIAIGLPFMMFTLGGTNWIRADGSPVYSMMCTITCALINVVLDYVFIFPLNMDMTGAALATIIGQIVSALLVIRYLRRFKQGNITKDLLKPRIEIILKSVKLGISPCINQLSLMLLQIVMNNTLRYYGSMSIYGSEIPLAVVGIVTKVNVVFIAIVVGISQGCQPIFGFNYGARNYLRVKETLKKASILVICVGLVSFALFQLFPRQIVSIFGTSGTSELYYQFAENYFRTFLFFVFVNGLQPLTGNFFTSIGKARIGIFVSLTRQVIFLIPLIIILPMFMGVDGVLYSAPVADIVTVVLVATILTRESRKMTKLQAEKDAEGLSQTA